MIDVGKGGAFLVGTFFRFHHLRLSRSGPIREFVTLRRLPSGQPDFRFGRQGRVTTRFGRLVEAGAW